MRNRPKLNGTSGHPWLRTLQLEFQVACQRAFAVGVLAVGVLAVGVLAVGVLAVEVLAVEVLSSARQADACFLSAGASAGAFVVGVNAVGVLAGRSACG